MWLLLAILLASDSAFAEFVKYPAEGALKILLLLYVWRRLARESFARCSGAKQLPARTSMVITESPSGAAEPTALNGR